MARGFRGVFLRLILAGDDPDLVWLDPVIDEIRVAAEKARETFEQNRARMSPISCLTTEETVEKLWRRVAFLEKVRRVSRLSAVEPERRSSEGS